MKKDIVLVSFYNNKALGIRYLEKALQTAGYRVHIVFFKSFNSVKPQLCTQKELKLLIDVVKAIEPIMIGLSVMSTLYLETVFKVNNFLRDNFKVPIVWGGVYPSLFPKDCLNYADYVVRGEGEHTLIELAKAINEKKKVKTIQNIAFQTDTGSFINELRGLSVDPDEFGIPSIGGDYKYSIDNNKIVHGDPQLNSISYELCATKGCPYTCSYCSSINLRRMYKGKGSYIRYRSVTNVINELLEAKRKMKNLKYIRFWDEIFSDDETWIEDFCNSYKKYINLPFEIWSHPLRVNEHLISKLLDAGLFKVVMGIQSGSPRILKDVFHRYESIDDIIKACKIFNKCRVPEVVYDFILRHPFETEEDIKATYELTRKLPHPFELQLHGLNFLPGTDIVKTALDMKLIDYEQMDRIMYGNMDEQYSSYWGNEKVDPKINFWYHMIHMSQFKWLHGFSDMLAERSEGYLSQKLAALLFKLSCQLVKVRHINMKFNLILKSIRRQIVFNRNEKKEIKKAFTNFMQ